MSRSENSSSSSVSRNFTQARAQAHQSLHQHQHAASATNGSKKNAIHNNSVTPAPGPLVATPTPNSSASSTTVSASTSSSTTPTPTAMTTNNTTLPTIAGTMDKSPIPTVVVPRTPPSYHVTSAATRNSTGTTPPMAEDSSSLIATPSTNNPPIGRHPSPLTPPLTPAHALSSSSKLIEEVDESVGFVESNIIGNDAHSTPPASAGKDKPTYVGGQQSRYVPLTPVTPKQGNPSSSSFDSPHSSGTNSLVEPVSISSSPYGLSSDEVVGSTPNGGLDTGIGLGGVSVVGVEGNLDAPQSPGRFLFLYVGPGPVGAGASTVGSECEKGSGGSEATIGSWDVEKMKEEFGAFGDLKGMYIGLLEKHGIIILAFYDVRTAIHAHQAFLSSRFIPSLQMTNNDNGKKVASRFVSIGELYRLVGPSKFISESNGTLEITLTPVSPLSAMVPSPHPAFPATSTGTPPTLRRFLENYGDLMSFQVQQERKKPPPQASLPEEAQGPFVLVYRVEYFDCRAARVLITTFGSSDANAAVGDQPNKGKKGGVEGERGIVRLFIEGKGEGVVRLSVQLVEHPIPEVTLVAAANDGGMGKEGVGNNDGGAASEAPPGTPLLPSSKTKALLDVDNSRKRTTPSPPFTRRSSTGSASFLPGELTSLQMELGAIARRLQSKKDEDSEQGDVQRSANEVEEREGEDTGAAFESSGTGGDEQNAAISGSGGGGRKGKTKATPRTAPATPRRDLSILPDLVASQTRQGHPHSTSSISSRYPSISSITSNGLGFAPGHQADANGAADELYKEEIKSAIGRVEGEMALFAPSGLGNLSWNHGPNSAPTITEWAPASAIVPPHTPSPHAPWAAPHHYAQSYSAQYYHSNSPASNAPSSRVAAPVTLALPPPHPGMMPVSLSPVPHVVHWGSPEDPATASHAHLFTPPYIPAYSPQPAAEPYGVEAMNGSDSSDPGDKTVASAISDPARLYDVYPHPNLNMAMPPYAYATLSQTHTASPNSAHFQSVAPNYPLPSVTNHPSPPPHHGHATHFPLAHHSMPYYDYAPYAPGVYLQHGHASPLPGLAAPSNASASASDSPHVGTPTSASGWGPEDHAAEGAHQSTAHYSAQTTAGSVSGSANTRSSSDSGLEAVTKNPRWRGNAYVGHEVHGMLNGSADSSLSAGSLPTRMKSQHHEVKMPTTPGQRFSSSSASLASGSGSSLVGALGRGIHGSGLRTSMTLGGMNRERKPIPEANIIDVERIEAGLDTRTTVMLKNIPNKMTSKDLQNFIGAVCPRAVDFLYLRIDFQNQCNVGYAFVNFIETTDLLKFCKQCLGKKWNMFQSEKVLQMSYANYQGKSALVDKFRNSAVLNERPEWRPQLFHSEGPSKGLPHPFPASNSSIRRERSSHIKAEGMYNTLRHQ